MNREAHPFSPPFADFKKKRIHLGSGGDQVAYTYPLSSGTGVIKEAKGLPLGRVLRGIFGNEADYLKRFELATYKQSDFQTMKGIFGEYLLDTRYVYGHSSVDASPTIYAVQPRRIEGVTLNTVSQQEKAELIAADPSFRQQMLEIMWGAKKTMTVLGEFPDIFEGNLIREAGTGRVYMIDPHSPSFFHDYIRGKGGALLGIHFYRTFHRTQHAVLRNWENMLQPTESEVRRLNQALALDPHRYEDAIEDVHSSGNVLLASVKTFIKNREVHRPATAR
jgi:hypothetical protein